MNVESKISGRCKDCIFSIAQPGIVSADSPLQCRRNPPVPYPMGSANAITGKPEMSVLSILPVVAQDFVCGEYDDGIDDDETEVEFIDMRGN